MKTDMQVEIFCWFHAKAKDQQRGEVLLRLCAPFAALRETKKYKAPDFRRGPL